MTELGQNYILIDMTNSRALARHTSATCLAALALIQFANVDCLVVRCGESKNYSRFNSEQLYSMAASAGVELNDGLPYNILLKMVRDALEAATWLQFPFTEQEVVKQLSKLAANSDKAYAFSPGAEEPTKLALWHCHPNVNRKREDCEQWVQFASGALFAAANGEAIAVPPVTRLQPTAPRTRTPAPAPSAPRAPRPAGAAANRPKAGTSTGTVWDIADEVSATFKDKTCGECRKEIVAQCVAKGINKSTASVQFGKWAASLPSAL